MGALTMLMIAVSCIVLGLPFFLEKVPPNRWAGFRTPRTVTDGGDLWYPINKAMGADFILLGLLALPMMALPLEVALSAWSVAMLLGLVHMFWAASALAADHDAKQLDSVERLPREAVTDAAAEANKPSEREIAD